MSLAEKKCVPCRGGVPPLSSAEIDPLLREVPKWSLNRAGHLERAYAFEGFAPALEFVNRVGALAENEGHHPDIILAWGKVVLELWTHKASGLTESDFIFAAKVDRIR